MKYRHKTVGISRLKLRISIALLALFFGFSANASSVDEIHDSSSEIVHAGNQQAIAPSDVLDKVNTYSNLLENIRLELGKPEVTPLTLHVSDVSPREVYFQALVLFRKSDRLAFEWSNTRKNAPLSVPTKFITPLHVQKMVVAALDRLRVVGSEFGVRLNKTGQRPNPNTQPTDVFKAIHHANRQLNLLLSHRIRPADVLSQIHLSIGLSKSILTVFNHDKNIPLPKKVKRKKPSDVYELLFDSLRILKKIYDSSDLEMMNFERKEVDKLEGVVTPSDVYSLSLVLVSELTHVSEIANVDRKKMNALFDRISKNTTPSDVYQHATHLALYLSEILNSLQQDQTIRLSEKNED